MHFPCNVLLSQVIHLISVLFSVTTNNHSISVLFCHNQSHGNQVLEIQTRAKNKCRRIIKLLFNLLVFWGRSYCYQKKKTWLRKETLTGAHLLWDQAIVLPIQYGFWSNQKDHLTSGQPFSHLRQNPLWKFNIYNQHEHQHHTVYMHPSVFSNLHITSRTGLIIAAFTIAAAAPTATATPTAPTAAAPTWTGSLSSLCVYLGPQGFCGIRPLACLIVAEIHIGYLIICVILSWYVDIESSVHLPSKCIAFDGGSFIIKHNNI